ncbi:MAG: hypothetical protein WCT01_02720 [Candidatus Shapirobacteria bacterium]
MIIRNTNTAIRAHLIRSYDLFSNGKEFALADLFDTYLQMQPSLHSLLTNPKQIDTPALNYSLARLPQEIFKTQKIIFGQTDTDFINSGIISFSRWQEVTAPSRRRYYRFDPTRGTLLVYISSDSDIDDFVSTLLSLALEVNKIVENRLPCPDSVNLTLAPNLKKITLLVTPHNQDGYQQIVKAWLDTVSAKSLMLDLANTPVYLVSSNTHSLVNIIGGYVRLSQDQIFNYVTSRHPDLSAVWENIKSGGNQIRTNDFLYYASSVYFKENPLEQRFRQEYETGLGIRSVRSSSALASEVQFIPINTLSTSRYADSNLVLPNPQAISESKALIVNFDYPLGWAAYFLLRQLLTFFNQVKGVYIIGKAAILTGNVGDIQIPTTVYDEKTGNTFKLSNVFNSQFNYQGLQTEILNNQKAVCVYGTYLENSSQLNGYIDTGFNIIEMESGPYLTAFSEHFNITPTGTSGQNINLTTPPLDLGIINYASDNPLTQNLGAGAMALRGIEPTYLASIAAVQRIVNLESGLV